MALDIYAKQIPGIEIGRMDVATLLAFMNNGGGTTPTPDPDAGFGGN